MLFHEKHNYFVRITPVDGLVEISFPKNIFLDKPEMNVLIGMTPFALTAFFDDGFKEIVCPSHIMRPLLFKEII